MKTKIALYARVSTRARTGDAGHKQEVENQLQQLRRYARKMGWRVHREYVDRATGAKSERQEFARLFDDASRREFDLVLFWSLDRFTREGVLRTLQHLQRLSDSGVKWKSYQQEYLTTMGPFGPAIVAIFAALAEQERQVIRERVKAGLERAKKAGRVGGRPRRVFDREKAKRMRKQGMTYRAIGKALGVATMTARAAVIGG